MARRRFFVDEVRGGRAEIAGEDARHLTRVLRVERGQRYEISDNQNIYLAEVETAHKEQVEFRVLESLDAKPPAARIVLACALFKFDHLEWLIEKATELGVDTILPFAATRSDRGLDKASEKRVERWRRIAVEASQQSRRDRVPEIRDPAGFDAALRLEAPYRFVADEDPAAPEILDTLPRERSAEDVVALAVGPEGGWTDDEQRRFRASGWQPVGLGGNILRAETAAMAALAILTAAWRARSKV